MSQKISKQKLEHMFWFMEPKLHSNVSIKFIQSILFLEHPSKRKFKIKKKKEGKTIFKRKDRPNLLSDDLMAQVKTIMIGTRASGTAISCRIVMTIGNGVVKSNKPILLKENWGLLQMMDDCARGVLKSMSWVKRKATTGKIVPS